MIDNLANIYLSYEFHNILVEPRGVWYNWNKLLTPHALEEVVRLRIG